MNTTESSAAEEDKMMSTTNQTETEMDCSTADEEINNLFKGYVLNSVIITVGLSFVVLRRNLCRNCCWGRPGFLQPLSFMDEIGRRWAYAAGFVIIANDILPIFLHGQSHFEVIPRDNEERMRRYVWLSVLKEFFEAMCICLVFYPLLACIDHRHSIAANVVGILYLIPWISTYTAFFCTCQIRAGFLGVAPYHLLKIPIYVAFYVVGVSYVLDFVRNCLQIRNRCRKASDKTMSARDITEKRSYKVAHHLEYVVNLLHKRSPEQTDETKSALKAKSKKLIKKAKYEKILGFRYSTRIVASLTVSATLLFWIVIITAVLCECLIEVLIELCNTSKHFAPFVKTLCEYVIIARILLHVANAVAGLVIMGFLFNTLITYKRRWHQLLRGDHSWHMYGSTMVNPQNTLLNGLKFAGYQAAYAAWGWVVLMLVLSFILVFLTFLLMNIGQNWLIRWLSRLWPTILVGLITGQVEKLICRFCFLQGNGSVMALDNRRVYNAVSYYFLVLNVIVGFFSCMKRILIPFVLGVAFLSRLDRPLIMSGFETKDPGFASFVSMLLVDLYHNHPVVKTFVELMLKVREQREQQELQQQEQQKQTLSGKEEEDAGQEAGKHLRSKMIRNRWLKTLTLVNNPSLAVKVLEQRLKDERKNAEQATALLPATAEDDSYAIEMQPLQDNKETTSSLQVLVR